MWPSGPRPRWTRSRTGGVPAIVASVAAYRAAAASRSADSTGIACTWSGRSGTRASRLSRRCVRLRSGSPAGATRSSTCTTCTPSHGTSSSASARSIIHGVRPPLTAMTKRPRAATAARASVAINAAAAAAPPHRRRAARRSWRSPTGIPARADSGPDDRVLPAAGRRRPRASTSPGPQVPGSYS